MINRRRALLSLAGLAAVAGGSLLLCKPADAHHHPYTEPPPSYQNYSVDIERTDGSSFPTYWHGGSAYVAGNLGERYVVRVNNHSGRRIEAVVTVDGRDVISGDLGDYRKHRGYIVEPYGSVTIDGFRQSLDHVAAFRFSEQSQAYSTRRGTPQHVGVVGVAVFNEYRRPKPKPRRYTRPVYPNRPYYDGDPYPAAEESRSSGKKSKSGGRSDRPAAGAAESAPNDSYDYGGYSRPAPRRERLGTEYGETRYSSVREVTFKRRNKRRPDAIMTVYYDSMQGLRDRGIPVDPYPYPDPDPYPYYEPDPLPRARLRTAPAP